MEMNQVVKSLKEIVKTEPVANGVLLSWALRQRARKEVTLSWLQVKMRREGFNFQRKEYEHFLKELSDMGVGKLKLNGKGQILALGEIPVALQSLGQAVLGQNAGQIRKLYPKASFVKVAAPLSVSRPTAASIGISIRYNGSEVVLSVPDTASHEIDLFIKRLMGFKLSKNDT